MKEEIIEQTKKWIKKAERDIISAEILLSEKIYDYSLFHSQQAVEKFLKSFLTFKNVPFRKTHDITLLLKKCIEIDDGFVELEKLEIDRLYPIAIEIRYPEFDYEVTEDDAKKALEIARKVRDFVLRKIKPFNL